MQYICSKNFDFCQWKFFDYGEKMRLVNGTFYSFVCNSKVNRHRNQMLFLYYLRWVGGGFRKWQFSLTLCTENVLTQEGGGGLKKPKHPQVIKRWFLSKKMGPFLQTRQIHVKTRLCALLQRTASKATIAEIVVIDSINTFICYLYIHIPQSNWSTLSFKITFINNG